MFVYCLYKFDVRAIIHIFLNTDLFESRVHTERAAKLRFRLGLGSLSQRLRFKNSSLNLRLTFALLCNLWKR